jgi:hypothetical protein
MSRIKALFGAAVTAVLVLTCLFVSPAGAGVLTASAARPGNGKILFSKGRTGAGVLTIKNGNARDAVITLVRGKSKAVSMFIRAKKSASIKGLKDGTYRVYFTSGYRYSTSKRRFTKSASYQIFDQKLRFVTTATAYTHYTLTLYAVKGGNAHVSPVDPKHFPV